MRPIFRTLALAGIVTATLSLADSARAAFPTATSTSPFWIPIRRAGAIIQDPVATTNADYRDIVGDATHPAAFLATDATNLYLRIRVNGDPGAVGSLANARGWGCMIDTNNDNPYERLITLDGNGTDAVKYWTNAAAGSANASTDNADANPVVVTATNNGNASVSTADTTFSNNPDFFVDFSVPWATIRTGGITAATALRFVCGTTVDAVAADDLATDIFDNAAATVLSTTWSDAYTCNKGTDQLCSTATDNDGDGIINTDETAFGTNPNNADSDGDGIPDIIELTAPGAASAYSAVNTDNVAPIDALDTDSDNDCIPDSADGIANYRNASLPNANASAACTADPAKALCDTGAGVCNGCNGDLNGGGPLACPTAAAPWCNTTGALAGRCTACTATQSSACTGATPACDTATGTCAPCNGNTGSGATAACKTILNPACQPAGATLAGRCTQCSATNTSNCPNATPACSGATGTCAICSGQFGEATNAPCPTAAAPACNTAGAFNGRCTVCTPSNTTLCTAAKPACDPNNGICVKCDGDRGTGSLLQCPSADAPNCIIKAGAEQGSCKKCTSSADCGLGHAGPTCDTTTGACVDVDTDGDGLQDEIENQLGTDPTKKDSDGDGIDDKTEVTPIGGGAFAKVDTDNDGTIDARDLDSDDDGIPDAEEARVGDAGPLLDTDGDKAENYRDADDDGDSFPTKDEVADAKKAGVSDDVDNDGEKNWLDSDANGNSINDKVDGKDDDDNDGIPNYLDTKKTEPTPEAGASTSSSSTSSSSSGNVIKLPSSSSGTPTGDAGAPTAGAPEDGVLEGSGCSTSGGTGSSLFLVGLGVVAVGLASRRRRPRA